MLYFFIKFNKNKNNDVQIKYAGIPFTITKGIRNSILVYFI